jgi:hypothetical protein
MAFITAYAIQQNEQVFLTAPDSVGQSVKIPTPVSGGRIDGDYWAVPVGIGVISGFNFEAIVGPPATVPPQPTPDSFRVTRISTNYSNDFWYVVGTSTNYINVSSAVECCNATDGLPSTVPCLSPCSYICDEIASGAGGVSAAFGLPTLAGGETYHLCGYLNNEALPTPSGAGYGSVGALLTFLNTNWNTSVGSPPSALVWSASGDAKTLLVTAEDGLGDDLMCLYVYAD